MASTKVERRIRLAVRAALKSPPHERGRMGCVLFKKKRFVSFGHNDTRRTHPKSATPYHRVHAELDAVLGVDQKDLLGCIAYVARIRMSGLGLASPCKFCREVLSKVGIREVYYTLDNGTIGHEVLK